MEAGRTAPIEGGISQPVNPRTNANFFSKLFFW